MVSAPRLRLSPTQPPEGMESISKTAPKAGKAGSPVLLSFDEMPEWFRRESNRWILLGYRPISGSARASFCSWSYIHNESVTIYSHLIPAVLFLFSEYSRVTAADFVAFSIFILAGVICLSLSATYHTLMNHSQYVEHLYLRLDMLGIVILILGDLILGIYMVFWCEPLPRKIYWSMVGVFGTLTIFMTMHPKFQGAKYRLFRALIFVATGLSGVAPLIHGLMFPESRYPGKFDLCGSHSIFHILVVSAAVVQLMGYLDAFDYAQTNITCSSP
ncbi:hemolysin-III related-domain-containing protein [Aspergillus carlsbadensis]|nr:hemolysin-III related-domain-containing protein [Aspergillus carlsbadensis]